MTKKTKAIQNRIIERIGLVTSGILIARGIISSNLLPETNWLILVLLGAAIPIGLSIFLKGE